MSAGHACRETRNAWRRAVISACDARPRLPRLGGVKARLAFTIVIVGARLGAVTLATLGAVSTMWQTRPYAIVFTLAGAR